MLCVARVTCLVQINIGVGDSEFAIVFGVFRVYKHTRPN